MYLDAGAIPFRTQKCARRARGRNGTHVAECASGSISARSACAAGTNTAGSDAVRSSFWSASRPSSKYTT